MTPEATSPARDAAAPAHHAVVVIGGGNAGLSVAGRLGRYGISDVAVIEPRENHLYQPMFSHIAGGTAQPHLAVRRQASVTPSGTTWMQERVSDIDAAAKTVVLQSGRHVTYDHLVVCPGIQKNYDAVPGLADAMASPSGISNYEFDLAAKSWRVLRQTTRGTVVFTEPAGPATCAGASQKPMYLACDYWRQQNVLKNIRVVLVLPYPTLFGMPLIDRELARKVAEYGIEVRYSTELVAVDAAAKTVTLRRQGGGTSAAVAAVPRHGVGVEAGGPAASGTVSGAEAEAQAAATAAREELAYDVLHAVPPQSAPDWLAATDLAGPADPGGFVEVDPLTLRHRRYPTVWSLGDAAATTNSKSGGALRQQTLVLAKNLVSVMKGYGTSKQYNGYSVCPFTVSRSTVVFSEFDGQYRPKPTIPFWKGLAKERHLTWIADRYVLPWVYWNLILKGRA